MDSLAAVEGAEVVVLAVPVANRAAYLAIDAADLSTQWRFDLAPDGSGTGTGPSGAHHERFRTWKEDLRDHGTAE